MNVQYRKENLKNSKKRQPKVETLGNIKFKMRELTLFLTLKFKQIIGNIPQDINSTYKIKPVTFLSKISTFVSV
jgi:hypothetical protein